VSRLGRDRPRHAVLRPIVAAGARAAGIYWPTGSLCRRVRDDRLIGTGQRSGLPAILPHIIGVMYDPYFSSSAITSAYAGARHSGSVDVLATIL
jgi:hypothetical protein